MTPTLSICLPVWNGETYVAEAIDSILAQTYPHFELIVQDDHSTDKTAAILARYTDLRVQVARNDEHLGQCRTLNAALGRATGRYIRFFCHDDRMLPTDLEAMVRLLQRHPELGLCFGRYQSIDARGRVLWVTPRIPEHDGSTPLLADPDLSARLFFKYGCMPGSLSTVMVTRAAIEACGKFDARFVRSLDFDLWMRISRRFPIGILAEVLSQIRDHPLQLTKYGDQAAGYREGFAIRARLEHLLPPDYLAPRHRYLRDTYWLGAFRCAVRALGTGRLTVARQVFAEIASHTSLLPLCGLYILHVGRTAVARQRREQPPYV